MGTNTEQNYLNEHVKTMIVSLAVMILSVFSPCFAQIEYYSSDRVLIAQIEYYLVDHLGIYSNVQIGETQISSVISFEVEEKYLKVKQNIKFLQEPTYSGLQI